jgi:DNA-binding NtrC family response regulator
VRVLVVDDEIRNAELTSLALRDAGHASEFVNGGAAAIRSLEAAPFDAVVTDLRMAPPDGLALLEEVRRRWPETAVVLMTAYASVETARSALTRGAYDYVDKEGDFHDELATLLERLGRERGLRDENRRLTSVVDSLQRGLATIVGESAAVRRVIELARKVAATDSTVLLRGESGTGKDLFARAIHFSSRRAAGPWVKVNCGALPENLLESELFGHVRGAFTGATRDHLGLFRTAQGGSVLLDEIGELPLRMQTRLLRVLQEQEVQPVGGGSPVRVDVRVLAATNQDLEARVKAGRFR